MRYSVMVAGQEDVTWPQWLALAQTCEDAGIEALFRSDHYQSVQGDVERGSLDAWATLAALATRTTTLRLGTLVSPTTFRHPSVLAKCAVTADHISSGRVELGIGAGWHAPEHDAYGFPFPDPATRYAVFEEQVEIVRRQLDGETFDFDGAHYRLDGCQARPVPIQARLPVIVAGRGRRRGARLGALHADEYNTAFVGPREAEQRKVNVERACREVGRSTLPFSVMTGCILGKDKQAVRDRAALFMQRSAQSGSVDDWLDQHRATWVIGTLTEAKRQVEGYRRAGVSRLHLRHQLHDDLDMVGLLGELAAG